MPPNPTRWTAWLELNLRMAQMLPSSSSQLLQRRLALLQELADSLELSPALLATASPEKLDQQTAQQLEMCRQLRALCPGLAGQTQTPIDARLANDLQVIAKRVGDLNRLYAALLRRRRRTVDIFCRVLATSGTTYPAPKLRSGPRQDGSRRKG